MTFCDDKDLLHWEPNLFIEAATVSQTLLSGSGNLEGTTFSITSDGPTLNDAHVAPNHVVIFSGGPNGSFPVTEIVNPTKLGLSVLYDDISAAGFAPSPAGFGEGVAFAVRTFWPQRNAASEAICAAARIDPADASAVIRNPEVLRRACVLGTIQIVLTAMAAGTEDPSDLLSRARMYEQLYRRAVRSARLKLDLNGDGRVDQTRSPGALQLTRG